MHGPQSMTLLVKTADCVFHMDKPKSFAKEDEHWSRDLPELARLCEHPQRIAGSCSYPGGSRCISSRRIISITVENDLEGIIGNRPGSKLTSHREPSSPSGRIMSPTCIYIYIYIYLCVCLCVYIYIFITEAQPEASQPTTSTLGPLGTGLWNRTSLPPRTRTGEGRRLRFSFSFHLGLGN